MDALKKAEQAKQMAAAQPGAPMVSDTSDTEDSLLDESLLEDSDDASEMLQPPLELLAEAEKDAQSLADQEENALPSAEYAYEWVDELDLSDDDESSLEVEQLLAAADNETLEEALNADDELDLLDDLLEEDSPVTLEDWEDEPSNELTVDTPTLEIPSTDDELDLLGNLLEEDSPVVLEDREEPSNETSVDAPTLEISSAAIEAESPLPSPEEALSVADVQLQWMDEDEKPVEPAPKTPSPADIPTQADDQLQARLAAEQMLRADGHAVLQKKPSHLPVLLGFLVLVGLLLGGGYYGLMLLLNDMESSFSSPEMAAKAREMQLAMKETGCKTIACVREKQAEQQPPTPPATTNTPLAAIEKIDNHVAVVDEPLVSPVTHHTPEEVATVPAPPTAVDSPPAKTQENETPPPSKSATNTLTLVEQAAALALPQPPAMPLKPAPAKAPENPQAQRPQGRFFDALTRYELDQLAEKGFVISRQTAPPTLQSQLNQAYQAYQAGQQKTAVQLYQKVLQHQPQNRDALLGLGALAQQYGDKEQASAFYRQVLRVHPNDAVAQTSLMTLHTEAPNVDEEQQLREQITRQPDAAWLHFALGNVYSRQKRWREAEEAYFQAYRHARENPDYAYNLAVSLEHLQKNRTALGFYEEALAQVEQGTSARFQAQQVRQRIEWLREMQ